MDPSPTAKSPNTDLAKVARPRSWVWHATLESRKAGQVSVLACAETIFAVALYWWIAIRFDTHWHLFSSVFIAPLLLLRSPESIAAGVRWFRNDWIGLNISPEVIGHRRDFGTIAIGLTVAVSTYFTLRFFGHTFITGQQGGAWIAEAALMGIASATIAIATLVSIASFFAEAVDRVISDAIADPKSNAISVSITGVDSDSKTEAIEESIKKALEEGAGIAMKVVENSLVAISSAVDQAFAIAAILFVAVLGMTAGTIASLGFRAGVVALQLRLDLSF